MGTIATTIIMIALAYQEEGRSTTTRRRKIIPLTVHAIHAPHHILSHGIPIVPCVRHVVPSLYHLAALYDTVSGCRRATLIIRYAHFFFHLLAIISLCFFDVFPIIPQKPFVFWST